MSKILQGTVSKPATGPLLRLISVYGASVFLISGCLSLRHSQDLVVPSTRAPETLTKDHLRPDSKEELQVARVIPRVPFIKENRVRRSRKLRQARLNWLR
jgi:hypothetical protein